MLTLWCIFRSPLMIGTDLPQLDDWTLSLLTNHEVMTLSRHTKNARQVERDERHVIWCSEDIRDERRYLAIFNLQDKEAEIALLWDVLKDYGICAKNGTDLWERNKDKNIVSLGESVMIPAHGAALYCLIPGLD